MNGTLGDLRRRLRDLDRHWVPLVAAQLDRLLHRPAGRFALTRQSSRVLGALAAVLLGCALGLFLIGGR